MFGFNLTEASVKNRRVVDIGVDDISSTRFRYLLLFPNEVTLYGNALSNIRCMYNATDFDMGRVKDIDSVGSFFMSFFEFKNTTTDEYGYPVIADAVYKNVRLDPSEKGEFSGPLNTGYATIDNFVNKYAVIRLDTKEVYSPLKVPFVSTEEVDELFFILFMFGPDVDIEGFEVVDSNNFRIDGEMVSADKFYDHKRAPEIIVKIMQKIFDNAIIFISDTIGDEAKYKEYIESDTKGRMTAFICPYSE